MKKHIGLSLLAMACVLATDAPAQERGNPSRQGNTQEKAKEQEQGKPAKPANPQRGRNGQNAGQKAGENAGQTRGRQGATKPAKQDGKGNPQRQGQPQRGAGKPAQTDKQGQDANSRQRKEGGKVVVGAKGKQRAGNATARQVQGDAKAATNAANEGAGTVVDTAERDALRTERNAQARTRTETNRSAQKRTELNREVQRRQQNARAAERARAEAGETAGSSSASGRERAAGAAAASGAAIPRGGVDDMQARQARQRISRTLVQAEQIHRQRMARINRLEEVFAARDRSDMVKRVNNLRQTEMADYEKRVGEYREALGERGFTSLRKQIKNNDAARASRPRARVGNGTPAGRPRARQ